MSSYLLPLKLSTPELINLVKHRKYLSDDRSWGTVYRRRLEPEKYIIVADGFFDAWSPEKFKDVWLCLSLSENKILNQQPYSLYLLANNVREYLLDTNGAFVNEVKDICIIQTYNGIL